MNDPALLSAMEFVSTYWRELLWLVVWGLVSLFGCLYAGGHL